ncbi:MAG: S1 RNA-binding domain-containing protein, partial [Pseudomonadales bacterium]|nr:S1 RNA-binding domain-containing protein [Pseudomonadales bacterium]
TIRIYGKDKASRDAAVAIVEGITAEAEVGAVYEGKVERIVDFGAFISILPGKDGLLHISQISSERIEKVTDVLEEGQVVKVKVLDVDQRGRIKLSMKELEEATEAGSEAAES